jgi:hypothetical protein
MFLNDADKYKTTFNIDKVNHPDTEIVKFAGKDIQLGEVRKLYESFEEKKYNMLSFYDDMFQYTSLGLIDLIFEIHKINSPIPIKSFINRRNVYGKYFVYELMKRFKINKEEIDTIEKKYYEEVLRRSPISANAEGYFKMRDICQAQLMIFKYPFSLEKRMARTVQEAFGKNEYISFEIDYCKNLTEEEYIKASGKSRSKYFDIVICQDAASVIEYIDAHKIYDTHILTPLEHCGLSNEMKYAMEAYTNGVGPNNCRLHYVNEKI